MTPKRRVTGDPAAQTWSGEFLGQGRNKGRALQTRKSTSSMTATQEEGDRDGCWSDGGQELSPQEQGQASG